MNELCWDPCLVGERFTPIHRRAPFGRVPLARCCDDSPCCSPEPACSPLRANCSPAKDFFARERQDQMDSQSEVDIKMPKTCETHILDHMRCNCVACMKFACMWRQGVKKTLRSKIKNPLCSNNPRPQDKASRRPQKCTRNRGVCPKRNVSPRSCRRNSSPQFKPCFQASPQIDHLCSPRLNQKRCCKFYARMGSPACGCLHSCACQNVCLRGGGRHFRDGEETNDGFRNVAMDGTWGESELCDKPVECCTASLRAAAVDDCISHHCVCPARPCCRHEYTPSTTDNKIERQDCDIISPSKKYDFGCLESLRESLRKNYFPRKAGSDITLDNTRKPGSGNTFGSNNISDKFQKAHDIHYSRSQQWYQDLSRSKEPSKCGFDLDRIRSLISPVALKASDVLEGKHPTTENSSKPHGSWLTRTTLSHSPYMDFTRTGCMKFHDNCTAFLDDAKSYLCQVGRSSCGDPSMYLSQRLQNNSCLLKPATSEDPWKKKGVLDTLKFESQITKEVGDSVSRPYIKKYCGDTGVHDIPSGSFDKSLDLRLERILSQTFENVHEPLDDFKRRIGGILTDFPAWVPTYKETETVLGKKISFPVEHSSNNDFSKMSDGVRREFTGTPRRWNQYTEADYREQKNKPWLSEHKPSSDRNGDFTEILDRADVCEQKNKAWFSVNKQSSNCKGEFRRITDLADVCEQQNKPWLSEHKPSSDRKGEFTRIADLVDVCEQENRPWFSENKPSSDRKGKFTEIPDRDIPSRSIDKCERGRIFRDGLLGGGYAMLNQNIDQENEIFSQDANVQTYKAIRVDDGHVASKGTKSGLTYETKDKRGNENDTNERREYGSASRNNKPRDTYFSRHARGSSSPERKQSPEKDTASKKSYKGQRHSGVDVEKAETGKSEPKEDKDALTEATEMFHTARSCIDDEPKAEMVAEGSKDVTLDDISDSFGSGSLPREKGGRKIKPSPKRKETPQLTPGRERPRPTQRFRESLDNKQMTTTSEATGKNRNRPSPERRDFFRSRNLCPSEQEDNDEEDQIKFQGRARFREKIDILLPADGYGTTGITSLDISPILWRKKTGRRPRKELDDISPRRSPYVYSCKKNANFWRAPVASPGKDTPSRSPVNGLFRPSKRKTPPLSVCGRALREPMSRTEGEWLVKHTRLMNECVRERQSTSRARVQRLVRKTADVRESMSDLSIDLDKMEKQLDNVRILQQGYIRRAISAVRLLEKKRDRHSISALENRHVARERCPDLGLKGPWGVVDYPSRHTGATMAEVTQGLRGLVARTKTGRNIRELDELYSYFVNNDQEEGGDLRRGNGGMWSLSSLKSHRNSRHSEGKHDVGKFSRDEQCWLAEKRPSMRAESCSVKRENTTRTSWKSRNKCPRKKDVSVNFSKMKPAWKPAETSDSLERDAFQSGFETEEESDAEQCETFRAHSRGQGQARVLGAGSRNFKEPSTSRCLKPTSSSSRKMRLGEPKARVSLCGRGRSEKLFREIQSDDRKYDAGGAKAPDISNSRLNTTFTIE